MWAKDDITGSYRVSTWYCKRTMCETCAKRKSHRHTRAILDYIEVDRPCHHVILTVIRRPGPPRPQIEFLNQSFATLKKRACWRNNIIGGVKFIHMDFNEETQVWGPHLHLVLEAACLPSDQLSVAWAEITGGSWSVHDRRIDMDAEEDRQMTVGYAAGYVYKKWADNESALDEFAKATKGKRFAGAFGEWYGKVRLSPNRNGVPSLALAEPSSNPLQQLAGVADADPLGLADLSEGQACST
jgi:hypothetical protein